MNRWIGVLFAIGYFALAAGLVAGSQRARWWGAGLALVNGIGQISGLPGYPSWFLVVTALDMIVLFGLAIYGRRSAVQERKLA